MMVVEASALNTVLRGIRRILLVKLNCRWHTVIHTTYNWPLRFQWTRAHFVCSNKKVQILQISWQYTNAFKWSYNLKHRLFFVYTSKTDSACCFPVLQNSSCGLIFTAEYYLDITSNVRLWSNRNLLNSQQLSKQWLTHALYLQKWILN